MLPKNLALDEVATPKNLDELLNLTETTFRVEQELTTLESITLKAIGILQTPAGEWQVSRNFLERCAVAIGMPLTYAYRIDPELFCDNFAQRQAQTGAPITISRIGQAAIGLVIDRTSRYRPASTADVLRGLKSVCDLKLRRAIVTFAGVDVELVRPGLVVEPMLGDVIEVGISLTNSETGGRQLKASAYSYRLVCTNGAVMADNVGVVRWPNDPRMTEKGGLRAFQTGVVALSDRLGSISTLYKSIVDRHIPSVEFWNLWRRVAYLVPRAQADTILGVSEEERRDLQQSVCTRHLLESARPTEWNAYDIHNRLTHAAHGQQFHVRRGLQELGGELLSRATSWPPAVSLN